MLLKQKLDMKYQSLDHEHRMRINAFIVFRRQNMTYAMNAVKFYFNLLCYQEGLKTLICTNFSVCLSIWDFKFLTNIYKRALQICVNCVEVYLRQIISFPFGLCLFPSSINMYIYIHFSCGSYKTANILPWQNSFMYIVSLAAF